MRWQGGIIKYLIRRKILQQGFAFANAWAVYLFASTDEGLTCARLTADGIGSDCAFDISARTFVYVSEAEVAYLIHCSSPFVVSKAEGSVNLRNKQHMFCFRPDPNPPVSVFPCLPAHLGFEPRAGDGRETSEGPFDQATLNLIEATFTGTWRAMSCGCDCCLLDDGSRCTSMGRYEPSPWRCYTVSRLPAAVGKQGSNSFLAQMVDGLLAGSQGELEPFAIAVGTLIKSRLRRFQSVKQAANFVSNRALKNSPDNWVQRWLQKKHKGLGEATAAREAWDSFTAVVLARASELGWQTPRAQNSNGGPQPWADYVSTVVGN